MNYDIIGDVHGHANDLISLLAGPLGYAQNGDDFTPPDGVTTVFLGDYIDRGVNGGRVIRIVRSLIDRGHAIALMGNHEYNAICYATNGPDGLPLRPHKPGNVKQHQSFIDEFGDKPAAYAEIIKWFRTLPLFVDLGPIRAIHAAWDPALVAAAQQHEGLANQWMSDDFIQQSATVGSPEFRVIETLLKGPEQRLPKEAYFTDKGGKQRQFARLRWWGTPSTAADHYVMGHHGCANSPDMPNLSAPKHTLRLPTDARPVFFGHYWFKDAEQSVGPNWACLDHSIAKHGMLSAYRYDSQDEGQPLSWRNIVSTNVSPG